MDGATAETNLPTFQDILNKTIFHKRKGTLKHLHNTPFIQITGPTHTQPIDSSISTCMAGYNWILNPTPKTMPWKKLMNLPDVIDHFRTVIVVALCTSQLPIIYETRTATYHYLTSEPRAQSTLTGSQSNPFDTFTPGRREHLTHRQIVGTYSDLYNTDSDDDIHYAPPQQIPPPATPTAADHRAIMMSLSIQHQSL